MLDFKCPHYLDLFMRFPLGISVVKTVCEYFVVNFLCEVLKFTLY